MRSFWRTYDRMVEPYRFFVAMALLSPVFFMSLIPLPYTYIPLLYLALLLYSRYKCKW